MTAARRIALPILMLSLGLVASARFNRTRFWGHASAGAGPLGLSAMADAIYYVDMVRWFRGEKTQQALAAPFVHRPLAPLLASFLPVEPLTALNLVNLAALGLSLACLYLGMRTLGASAGSTLGGGALFVFSFPSFYYGTIGYVDPVLVLFLSLFVLGLARENNWLMLAAFLLGSLAKEAMLAAAPSFVAAQYARSYRSRAQAMVWAVLTIVAALATTLSVRELMPHEQDRSHKASFASLVANASRPRAWASLTLSFGIPGCAATLLLAQRRFRRRLLLHPQGVPLLVGTAGCLAVAAYAFAVAYVDGRFVWTIYPFCIPMIGIMWSDWPPLRPVRAFPQP